MFVVIDAFLAPSLIKESEIANLVASTNDGEITAETYGALIASINPFAIIMMVLQTMFLTLVYWFVPALIMWNKVATVKSIVFSCIGIFRNITAFISFGISIFIVAFIIWVLMLFVFSAGIGGAFFAFILQLIFVSLLMTVYCAMYISYKQIYQNAS